MYEKKSQQIINICQKLYDLGYILARSGNVSCKTQKNKILITPTRVRKHSLNPNDLCLLDLEGKKLEGELCPSSEYRVHCAIYNNRPDVSAVVHGHPVYSIIASLAKVSLAKPILPETALSLGSIPTIPYTSPGSQELANSLVPYLAEHNAFILQRHGVVALGGDLEEAFDRLQEVEHAATIAYALSIKGKVPVLGRSDLSKIFRKF